MQRTVNKSVKSYICKNVKIYLDINNKELIKEKYRIQDVKINEKRLLSLESYNPNNEAEIEQDNTPTAKEIDDSIDRLMLRDLFEHLYEFNESKYRNDYIERASLIEPEDIKEQTKEGYSLLNEKLTHPLKYYCSKRKQ